MLYIVAAALVGLGILFAAGPRRGRVAKAVGWALYALAALTLALAIVG